jgi:transcriptional regulator with XRE-family HTH domain
MDMRKAVGTNFMRLRKARGLTQEQVAETSGYGQNYISSLERGRRNPTVITLFLLAEAISATPRDLVAPIDEDAA